MANPRDEGIPLSPSLEAACPELMLPRSNPPLDRRVYLISGLAVLVALAAGCVAQLLTWLISLITNLAFHQRLDASSGSPAGNSLGLLVIIVPVVGGLVVGVMARYGSRAIRGHGIPEAMEQILLNESRIPWRLTFLKPLSAAIAIGTGGPFGAEGPIIATGGALGSVLGQLVPVSAAERKTLLAAGAAAGMAATFGSPVSAVLLAVELLLFEYRSRSIIPVALAASVATAVRYAFVGSAPIFPMEHVLQPGAVALGSYVGLGAFMGVCAVLVTKLLYRVEDAFERLPVSWVWWPAIGGLGVGIVGYWSPRTLGVGYINIEETLRGDLVGVALATLCVAKLASWVVALGSGTSGGTLAPLFTIGGAIGALVTTLAASVFPGHQLDPRIGALVGMAAIFAGASRAMLASVVFAFECTRQPIGLLPLLGGCTAAYCVSSLLMQNTIMTEKLARRGVRVGSEYQVDELDVASVAAFASRELVTVDGRMPVSEARAVLERTPHQGYPVLVGSVLVGVVSRASLLDPTLPESARVLDLVTRSPVVVFADTTLREAADHMLLSDVGRVVVVDRGAAHLPIGILTRSDLLRAQRSSARTALADPVEVPHPG